MAPNSEGRLEGQSNSANCPRSNRSDHVRWTAPSRKMWALSGPKRSARRSRRSEVSSNADLNITGGKRIDVRTPSWYVPSRRQLGLLELSDRWLGRAGRRRECPYAPRSSAPACRIQLPQILDEVYAEGSREGGWHGICDL